MFSPATELTHDIRTMAAVLRFFEVPEGSEGPVKATCKECRMQISGHMKTTSNFVKHLKVIISTITFLACYNLTFLANIC